MAFHPGFTRRLSAASPSEESLPLVHYPLSSSKQRTSNWSKPREDRAITAKICESAGIWQPYQALICSKSNAKFKIICIDCHGLSERDWKGRIIGKGVYGSINALSVRIKLKCTPLIGHLYTTCIGCCDKLYDKDKERRKAPVSISCEEIDEFFSSIVIIMEGNFAASLKTVDVEGRWKE